MARVELASRCILTIPSTYLFRFGLGQIADGKMQFWSKFYNQISKIRTAHLKTYSLKLYQQHSVRKCHQQRSAIIKQQHKPFLGLHLYLGAIFDAVCPAICFWIVSVQLSKPVHPHIIMLYKKNKNCNSFCIYFFLSIKKCFAFAKHFFRNTRITECEWVLLL